MSSNKLDQELKQLSKSGVTVSLLNAMDFVIPGDYHNHTSLDEMVRQLDDNPMALRTRKIIQEAENLYSEDEGAQRALRLYHLTDKADQAVAAAALANKVGSRFKVLSFLTKFTPKADTIQMIDLCLKVTVEAVAYMSLQGLSLQGVGDWAKMITQSDRYSNESALRLAGVIGFDGLVPLGPDFLSKVTDMLRGDGLGFQDNALFKQVSGYLPGDSHADKESFIQNTIESAVTPIRSFIDSTGLTREKALGRLKDFTDVSDDKLDYAAAFLDASTNYMSQTGTQTVARHIVQRAIERVDQMTPA